MCKPCHFVDVSPNNDTDHFVNYEHKKDEHIKSIFTTKPCEVELTELCNGGEWRISEMARISYGKDFNFDKNSNLDIESDNKLLETMFKQGHHVPFEFVSLTFRIKLPMAISKELVRHRMGSFIEKSSRRCTINEFYFPERKISMGLERSGFDEFYKKAIIDAYNYYMNMIVSGVPKEIARFVLPTCYMTEIYWHVNLRSFFNFLKQRLARSAQYEMRYLAKECFDKFEVIFPIISKIFKTDNEVLFNNIRL
jgi:thymidylate synthase (FAD)